MSLGTNCIHKHFSLSLSLSPYSTMVMLLHEAIGVAYTSRSWILSVPAISSAISFLQERCLRRFGEILKLLFHIPSVMRVETVNI
jgi:hypothetical protein